MIRLLALQARRDRVVLPIWVVGLALLLLVTVQATRAEYGDAADRRQVLALALATPVLLALRGVVDGDSLGSAVQFQTTTWLAVAVALMNTFLAVRHGRGDEAAGRRELVDATPVGRLAAPLATLVLAVVADAVLGAATALLLAAGGLPAAGSIRFGAALALIGLVAFGIGLLASEAMPTSRGANAVAVVVVLLLYALRAAGDALGRADVRALTLEPASVSLLSPIGWSELLRPFTRPAAWPLVALPVLAVVLIGVGLLVHARREPGASVVLERLGRPTGRIGGPLALAWRLQRPTTVVWALGAAALAAATPGLVAAASRLRFQNPVLRGVIESLGHSRADVAAQFVAAILVLVGMLAAAAGVQAVLRAREEEAAGRAEVLLAGPVSRVRWLVSWAAVAVATVAAVVLAATAAVALGSVAAGGDAGRAALQALVQAPSALALTAVAALLVGALPRLAVAGSWLVFAAAGVLGLFGGVLDVPDDVVRLTPIGSVPALPTDDWGSTWAMAAAVLVLGALALVAVRRREAA